MDGLTRHALEPQRKTLSLKDALSSVIDFRIDRRKKFPLYEILMIAVCALIDGAKGPTDYERFGKAKVGLLKRFLELENGIPSHDTFNRVLSKMDPMRFNAAIVKWLESLTDVAGDFISVDGKNLRRALTKDGKMPCIVSAHSSRTNLVIGQIKADEKSNEITAIPNLLEMLYLKGAILITDTRYFISSLPVDPKRALSAIRAHWGVEAMHWILDMDFNEDRSRARTGSIAENLAMLRHVVMNVLRLDKSVFGGISVKRKEITWDDNKLVEIMLAA